MNRIKNEPCGPVRAKTPLAINNRSGLNQLQYRIGSHHSLLRTMIAKLSASAQDDSFPILRRATARELDDGAIALLDAWATLGDLLTFYQERLANEAYLSTAKQRESVELLSRMVGFKPRPGLAASVYLAFEVNDNSKEAMIQAGTPAKSTPAAGSGQAPQTFETFADFVARPEWNSIRPRQMRPQHLTAASVQGLERLYFAGSGLRMQADDLIAIQPSSINSVSGKPISIRRVTAAEELDREIDGQPAKVTVAHLATDPVSGRALLERVEVLVKIFDPVPVKQDDNNKIKLFSADYLKRQVVDPIRQMLEDTTLRYIDADTRLQRDYLQNRLLGTFRNQVKDNFEAWFTNLDQEKQFSFENADYAVLRERYQAAHKAAYDALDPLAAGFAKIVASVQGKIWPDPPIAGELKPKLLFAGNLPSPAPAPSPPTNALIPFAPCPAPKITIRDDDVLSGYKHLHVKIERTRGIEIVTRAAATSRNTPITSATAVEAFQAAVESIRATATEYGYLRFHFRASKQEMLPGDADDGNWDVLGYGVQPLGANFDPPFKAFAHSVCFFTDTEGDTDPKVNLVPESFGFGTPRSGLTKIRAEIQTLPAEGEPFSSEAAPSVVATKLRAAVAAATTDDEPLQVQINLFDISNDANGPLIAFGHHLVVPRNPNQDESLAESLTPLHQPAAANALDSAESALKDIVDIQAETRGKIEQIVKLDLDMEPKTKISSIEALSVAAVPRIPEHARANELGLLDADKELLGREATSSTAATGLRKLWTDLRGKAKELTAVEGASLIDHIVNQASDDDSPFNTLTLTEKHQATNSGNKTVTEVFDDGITSMRQVLRLDANPYSQFIQTAEPSPPRDGPQRARIGQPYQYLDTLVRQILDKLRKQRKTFVGKLERPTKQPSFVKSLEPTEDSGNQARVEVKAQIDSLFSKEGDQSLNEKLSRLNSVITQDRILTAEDLSNSAFMLEDMIAILDGPEGSRNSGEIESIRSKADSLAPAARAAVFTVLAGWRTEIDRRGGAIAGQRAPVETDLLESLTPDGSDLSIDPVNRRVLDEIFKTNSDLIPQVLAALKPQSRDLLLDFARRQTITGVEPRVWIFRRQANLFGWNAPTITVPKLTPPNNKDDTKTYLPGKAPVRPLDADKVPNRLHLDGEFTDTATDGVVAIQKPTKQNAAAGDQGSASAAAEAEENIETEPEIVGHRVEKVARMARTDYGISNVSTRVDLTATRDTATWQVSNSEEIRGTRVWCDAERLPLAEEILSHRVRMEVLAKGATEIELDGFYPFLATQSMIVIEAIEREKDGQVGRIFQREINSIVAIRHSFSSVVVDYRARSGDDEDSGQVASERGVGETIYGDRRHTILRLKKPLARSYFREHFYIYANVVEATHGATIEEVVGSGDGSKPHQKMMFKSSPLTRLPAANLTGAEDQLTVRVNNVVWPQSEQLAQLDGDVEAYETSQSSDAELSLQFGDGSRGARLPSGIENVRSVYRVGLGSPGNVDAGRIDQLPSPPLGITSVRNPLRSSGGTDPDSIEQTRTRAAVWPSVLGRLLSPSDYRDFALGFAGIDKAHVQPSPGQDNGKEHRESPRIVLTVGGTHSEPLDETAALIRNLRRAIDAIGDPEVNVKVHPHRSLLIFLQANVAIDPRFEWEDVEARIRARLFEQFSYRVRDLNQDVLRAEIITSIQDVPGVVYVDVDKLQALRERVPTRDASEDVKIQNLSRIHLPLKDPPQESAAENAEDGTGSGSDNAGAARPAEICFMDPDAPDTLILEQIQ